MNLHGDPLHNTLLSLSYPRQIRHALAPYAVSSTPHGLALFVADVALYGVALAGVLFSPWGWLQGLASVFAESV